MSRLLSILPGVLLVLLTLLPRGAAEAAEDPLLLGQAELEKVFSDLILEHSSLTPGELTISRFTATPGSLEVPPGTREFRTLSRSQTKGELGRQTIVAEVLVNGVARGRVTLSADLALQGEVVCAARALPRHTLLAAGDLKRVRRDLTMLGPDLVLDPGQAVGRVLKTTLQPGSPLYGRLLKEPEMVKRGDIVTIRAATGSLSVTVPGRIQSAGARGDLVKVKNLMSRKEILAKVIGPDTVQVEL